MGNGWATDGQWRRGRWATGIDPGDRAPLALLNPTGAAGMEVKGRRPVPTFAILGVGHGLRPRAPQLGRQRPFPLPCPGDPEGVAAAVRLGAAFTTLEGSWGA